MNTQTHTHTQSTQKPGPLAIGFASRSFSNEAAGKDMFASLSRDGVVCAYVPDTPAGRGILPLLAAAPELLAFAESFLRWTAQMRSVNARLPGMEARIGEAERAIAKAQGGAL